MKKLIASILVVMFMVAGVAFAGVGSQNEMNQAKQTTAKKDTSMMKGKKGMKMSSSKSMMMKSSSNSMMKSQSSSSMMMKSSSGKMMTKKPVKSSKKDSTMMHKKIMKDKGSQTKTQ